MWQILNELRNKISVCYFSFIILFYLFTYLFRPFSYLLVFPYLFLLYFAFIILSYLFTITYLNLSFFSSFFPSFLLTYSFYLLPYLHSLTYLFLSLSFTLTCASFLLTSLFLLFLIFHFQSPLFFIYLSNNSFSSPSLNVLPLSWNLFKLNLQPFSNLFQNISCHSSTSSEQRQSCLLTCHTFSIPVFFIHLMSIHNQHFIPT